MHTLRLKGILAAASSPNPFGLLRIPPSSAISLDAGRVGFHHLMGLVPHPIAQPRTIA